MQATTKQARRNPALREAIAQADLRKPPLLSGDEVFEFHVHGVPAEQGSTHAYADDRGTLRVGHNDRGLKDWRKRVKSAAAQVMGLRGMIHQPIALLMGCEFILPREGAGKDWPEPTYRRDEDKLTRAVRDALSLTVYEDDGQVVGPSRQTKAGLVALLQTKRWANPGERPGVIIRIRLAPTEPTGPKAEP
jgi:Holliday junction resolvase RusA-like endonuclease